MSETENDRVDEVVDQFLRYLEEGTTRPSLHRLSESEQARARAIFWILESSWGIDDVAVRALDDDPIARRLGLVGQESAVTISGQAVRQARLSTRQGIDHVAQALGSRWPMVDVPWLFRLEQAAGQEVDAALAAALALELGVSLDKLRVSAGRRREDSLTIFLRSSVFSARVERWATGRGLDPQIEIQEIARELTGAPRRSSGDPGFNYWVTMLDALLRGRSR